MVLSPPEIVGVVVVAVLPKTIGAAVDATLPKTIGIIAFGITDEEVGEEVSSPCVVCSSRVQSVSSE